jgi:N-acylneuraminate cytidylyltransferase
MIAALIPARGGSKGIPNKNIIDINGMPMLAYSITAALLSKVKDVWVSTDSKEIAEVSMKYGARYLDRPSKYAKDDSSTEDVVLHFLKQRKDVNIVVLIQPTSPMILPEDIDNGIEKFIKEKYDSLFSGSKTNDVLLWNSKIRPINYDYKKRGTRQSRKNFTLHENGAFFIFTRRMFFKNKCRFGGKIGYSEMPYWRSFQVDDREDLANIKKLIFAKI